MSTRILTLFGEEEVPEPQKPEPKVRAKKNTDTPATTAHEKKETEDALTVEKQQDTVASEAAPKVTSIPQEGIAAAKVEAKHPEEKEAPQQIIPSPTPGKVKVTKPKPVVDPADIIPEDWKGSKTYYTIGEVADFFKVKTSHIRFWTNEFKLKVRTTRKGDRLYTPEQVKELRAIYHLVKERGFTLSGAKTKLKAQNNRDVATVDLKTSLLQLKNKLVKLRNQLV